MITAVDTSVLLDVFGADPAFGPGSGQALGRCLADGSLVACDVVWAEVAGRFPSHESAEKAMGSLGVAFSPVDAAAALAAGEAWRTYRERGGTRDRLIADFLIAGHALKQAERLLTRDRGFYRSYFEQLRLLDPTMPGSR